MVSLTENNLQKIENCKVIQNTFERVSFSHNFYSRPIVCTLYGAARVFWGSYNDNKRIPQPQYYTQSYISQVL